MIVRKVPPLEAPGARKNDHNLGPLQDLKAPLTKNGLLSWLRTPTLTHLSMVLSMDMLSPKCANALSPCLWASSPHMCKCLLSACVGVLSRRLLDNMAQPPWLGWKKKSFPWTLSTVLLFQGHQPTYLSAKDSSVRTLLWFFHSPTHPWWSKGSCGLVVISMNNRKLYKWPINKMFYMNGQLVMCTYIDLKAFTLMLTD